MAAPVLSRHLDEILDDAQKKLKLIAPRQLPNKTTRWLNLTIFLLLVIVSGLKMSSSLSSRANQEMIEAEFPVHAVEYLRSANKSANLFNSYNWGGYVIWELSPEFLSFVDGRTDLFNDEILEGYLISWQGLPGWEQVFEKWDIETVLVEPWAPIRVRLESQDWVIEYEDDLAVVLRSPE